MEIDSFIPFNYSLGSYHGNYVTDLETELEGDVEQGWNQKELTREAPKRHKILVLIVR